MPNMCAPPDPPLGEGEGAGDGDGGTARGVHRLVSAGDEKMVRVYSPTQEVLRGLWQLAGAGMGGDMGGGHGGCV